MKFRSSCTCTPPKLEGLMQAFIPPILQGVPFTSQPLRTLLVANADDLTHLIGSLMAASIATRFEVVHASNGWEALREAPNGVFDALVLDHSLSDTDTETLLGRLRAIGVSAPSLLLTSTGGDQVVAGGDACLPKTEGLDGNALARAI